MGPGRESPISPSDGTLDSARRGEVSDWTPGQAAPSQSVFRPRRQNARPHRIQVLNPDCCQFGCGAVPGEWLRVILGHSAHGLPGCTGTKKERLSGYFRIMRKYPATTTMAITANIARIIVMDSPSAGGAVGVAGVAGVAVVAVSVGVVGVVIGSVKSA